LHKDKIAERAPGEARMFLAQGILRA
jgi:hypothetical protein